jgi:hypothetical protein
MSDSTGDATAQSWDWWDMPESRPSTRRARAAAWSGQRRERWWRGRSRNSRLGIILGVVVVAILAAAVLTDSPAHPKVPVPPGAVQSAKDSGTYHMQAGAPYADLVSYYDQQMPLGRDWKGWKWCTSTSGPNPDGYWRTYVKSSESLEVIISPPSSGYPAGIIIGYSKDGGDPC